MNPYRAGSPCTPECVTHRRPPVPAGHAVRRCLALTSALTTGGTLDARALRLLDALGIRLDVQLDGESSTGTGTGIGRATVSGGARVQSDTGGLSVPGGRGTLIVANHVSWLDIVGLLAVEPVSLLAKREVAHWPWLGPLAARHGTLFIDRWALRSLPASVAAIAAHLRQGRSVAVFPEATTWCGAPGGPFRPAVFQAALDAGAPIRPVTLEYLQAGGPSTVAAFVGDDNLGRSMGRVARARDLTLRVRAHPALDPGGDRRWLAAQACRAVRSVESAHV